MSESMSVMARKLQRRPSVNWVRTHSGQIEIEVRLSLLGEKNNLVNQAVDSLKHKAKEQRMERLSAVEARWLAQDLLRVADEVEAVERVMKRRGDVDDEDQVD